ncbi:sensor histidine kinase [Lysobacter sp. cf310]|uniref:sensor histidine kinase n=1 Tax=Lysobacter sp. cf310 TaxID=1761790 RepID=UPI0008E4FF12|nr:histidine kinase [Lysobacter sp. cf310]SFK79622.1 two-component system, LytT family, sensor histidine kinase AlgZ [Lysobacter sp. cf310]
MDRTASVGDELRDPTAPSKSIGSALQATPMSPYWLPVLVGLPLIACTLLMALPVFGREVAVFFWSVFLLANLMWMWPLTAIQDAMRRRGTAKWVMALALLVITYLMSVTNNLICAVISRTRGWPQDYPLDWSLLLTGFDICWLVMIAFCVVHASTAYYAELQEAKARNRQALALTREAELRALRYQLHPHFLFNTLNAISSLVAEDRSGDARQMIARLAEFLRATLESGDRHEVLLAEELALTETYLEIERARLGARLRLRWSVGPDTLRARVPALLLQPLVENAIRHGIAPRAEPGRLEIRIERDGDRLHLHVGNDGAGDTRPFQSGRSVAPLGLRNILERLRALYPQAHSFAAGGRADGGYEVRLSLPFRETEAAALAG